MPGPNWPYTSLDESQVLRQSFDESTDRLRVDAEITATIVGPQEVIISAEDDNIAIRNTNNNNELLINSDGSINVQMSGGAGNATAANQVLEIASLQSIDGKLSDTANGLKVDGSGVTQPISASALPLPAGAATETTLQAINTKLTAPVSVTVSNFPAIQTVQGTVTVVQPSGTSLHAVIDSSVLPTGAATSSLQGVGNTSLASIDSKLTSPITVQGTIISNQGTSPWIVDGSATVQPISTTTLPLPAGASTSSLQSTANTSLASIDSKLTSPISVTGPLTDVQLRATPVPISGSISGSGSFTVVQPIGTNLHTVVDSSALPTGASSSALQATGNISLASIDSKTPALGQALAASSVPVVLTAAQITTLTPLTSVVVTQTTGTNLHTVVDSSVLPTGASTSSLQTTANTSLASIDTKLTSPIAVTVSSLPLPTGASTSALQTTGNTSLGSIDGKTPSLGQALAAGSVPVVLTVSQLNTLTPLTTVVVTQPTGTNLHTVVDSGTITANIGTTNGLALDTSVNSLLKPASTLAAVTSITNAVTVIQPTGTNLHTVIDSGTISLPTGASTSSLQTSGNTSLTSIDSKTPTLGQALAAASIPIVLTAAQLITLTPLTSVTVTQATGTNLHTVIDSGTITANIGTTNGLALDTSVNNLLKPASTLAAITTLGTITNAVTVIQPTGTNLHVVVDSSALPAGAATSAAQTTAQTSLTSIQTTSNSTAVNTASVDTKTPPLPATASSPGAASVTTASGLVTAVASNTRLIVITLTTSGVVVSLGLGGAAAVLNSGITLTSKGSVAIFEPNSLVTGNINAIGSAAANLAVQALAS